MPDSILSFCETLSVSSDVLLDCLDCYKAKSQGGSEERTAELPSVGQSEAFIASDSNHG